MFSQQQMQSQRAGLRALDTDDFYEGDEQQIVKHQIKNLLQTTSDIHHTQRENTQVTQSTTLSHHLLPGCGVGTKSMTQQSITNQSIPNLYTDNSISSKNLKDDQSDTLYLTTQQSPRNFTSSQEQQQYSSMSQFQYICQKFQLKMEDIMQIMQGFQDKEPKKPSECEDDVRSSINSKNGLLSQRFNIKDPESIIKQFDKNYYQNKPSFSDKLLVPSQKQLDLRYQSEVSQQNLLNEERVQEEQQFSQEEQSEHCTGNANSVQSNQRSLDRAKSPYQSQDMPLQYNPFEIKNRVVNKQQLSTQSELNESKINSNNTQNNFAQSLKSINFLNNSQNLHQGSTNHENSSQFSYQGASNNKSKHNSIQGDNTGHLMPIRNQHDQMSYQQFSQQTNGNHSKMTDHNNQKSDQYYETSQDNYDEDQQQQQYELQEDNYSQKNKQSVYSEESEQDGNFITIKCGNREDINGGSYNRYLDNEKENFSCPIQFFNGGFIVYSVNNGIDRVQSKEERECSSNHIDVAPEIVLFTSQSEQPYPKIQLSHSSNQQQDQLPNENESNSQRNKGYEHQMQQLRQAQNFSHNSHQRDDCYEQNLNNSEQKIDTQRSNQVFLQNDEISFTNQTFENRISRRLSEKTYQSNEYLQTDNQQYASQEPQYTQGKLDEDEEQYYEQHGDDDFAQLEKLRQLANGNSQIRQFSNRQSQQKKMQQSQQENTNTNEMNSCASSQQQHGMSIKEMKMSKQYQDPQVVGQIKYPSFNNSNQIFNSYGYQSEENGQQNIQNKQPRVHELEEEYQSEQLFLQKELQQNEQNNFCENPNNQFEATNASAKNSQQQFGQESFGEMQSQQQQYTQNSNYNQQYPGNYQRTDESYNDQLSQTFSQQHPSQNYDSSTSNDGFQNPHFARGQDYRNKYSGNDHQFQNSMSMDQSHQGSSQAGYYNQSNSSYHHHATQMLEKYVEEIKRLQQENQSQKLEIGELNGKLSGIQETKKDFELVIQSLKQNLECVTGLFKKKEDDYNTLFEKYNNLVETIQRSESKSKHRREISPSHSYKDGNLIDSYDRHSSRNQDLRNSCGKENRNSQEKAVHSQRCTESPKNILSQRDINSMSTLEKQNSKKSLNQFNETNNNPSFSQFKPPMIKNPKKLIQYDENNRRSMKRESSEKLAQQQQLVNMQQTLQKTMSNSNILCTTDLKKEKENIQKYSRKTSHSPNSQEDKGRHNGRSKSPSGMQINPRVNDENMRYQEQAKQSTKRDNLSGNRPQDTFLSTTKTASSSQTRYSDQFKKQKSYLQNTGPITSDKQVIDELRNFCFRKKQ